MGKAKLSGTTPLRVLHKNCSEKYIGFPKSSGCLVRGEDYAGAGGEGQRGANLFSIPYKMTKALHSCVTKANSPWRKSGVFCCNGWDMARMIICCSSACIFKRPRTFCAGTSLHIYIYIYIEKDTCLSKHIFLQQNSPVNWLLFRPRISRFARLLSSGGIGPGTKDSSAYKALIVGHIKR